MGQAMTVTQIHEQTPQDQMMTVKTSLLSPVNNLHLGSSQTSNRARSPLWGYLLSDVPACSGA